jgi:hypothetical protein
MNHDQLYLLKPDFQDRDKTYYCPGCAEVIGLLEFYPALKRNIDVHYLGFPRPRPDLVSLLGESNQSCPVLVLAAVPQNPSAALKVQLTNGRAFVSGAHEIGAYLAHVHGSGLPH